MRKTECETNLRRERRLEGIAAAKQRGVYKGRPTRKLSRHCATGTHGATAIAKRLGIGRPSVYRLLEGAKDFVARV